MIDHVVSDGNTITVTLTDGMSFDLTEAQLRNAFCWTNKKGKAMEKQRRRRSRGCEAKPREKR